jgi:hypothetical protein
MFAGAFTPQLSLRHRSRVPAISRKASISAVEIGCLLTCGVLAGLAVGVLHLSLRVPGHAILRGALPMVVGYALVPRRSAGAVMALGVAAISWTCSALHIGSFPISAVLSVLALGPILDLALMGQPTGWRLYARFAIAGVVSNWLALAVKLAGVQFGFALAGGGEGGARYGIAAFLVSYTVCGALAGFLAGAACFRARGPDDLRRD